MLDKKVNRRSAIKTTMAVAVVGAIATTVKLPSVLLSNNDQISKSRATEGRSLNEPEQYIYDIIARNIKGSKRVKAAHIEQFSKEFVRLNGNDFDYKATFPLYKGEHALMRGFIRSINTTA
ncbi:MAG: hypothetical protein HRU25_17535 [Psychrobium sp.]|nr:hypothetical protein [Psychrobium sp.]